MDTQTLRDFESTIRSFIPKFQVKFKDESWVQKLIGFFIWPFNSTYMTKYISTFYPIVYFPSRSSYEDAPKTSITVLAHEMVHMIDTQKHPIWFRLSYLFPQVLALIAFGIYVALVGWRAYPLLIIFGGLALGCAFAKKSMGAFWVILALGMALSCTLSVLINHWFSIPFFIGLACMAPWPAPGRVYWELRGYTVNLAVMVWAYGMAPEVIREMLIRHFIRSDYYFMSWSRDHVEEALDEIAGKVSSGELQKESPYAFIHSFFVKNELIRG